MSSTTKVVLGIVGGVLLLLVASCGIGGYALYSWAVKDAKASMIPHHTYESIKVGETEAEVMSRLPAKQSSFAQLGEDEKSRPKPAGATCRYYFSEVEHETNGSTSWYGYRFCFAGGKLVEKTTF